MRRTRLISIAALIAAGSLALAACGSSGGSTTPTTTSGSTTPAGTGTSPAGGSGSCGSGKLSADGSTAQQNAVNAWIKAFNSQCPGEQVVYSGVGSGQGITDFTAGTVDFAGSDAALDPSQGQMAAATKECGSPALDIPMVTGPVAVAFNVKGVTDLTLTPSVIAQIFKGKIKTWNDPAIAALNKGASLPSSNITVFFRSDESGTTQNFETYLNTAAPKDFPDTPSKDWAGTRAGQDGFAGRAGRDQEHRQLDRLPRVVLCGQRRPVDGQGRQRRWPGGADRGDRGQGSGRGQGGQPGR